MSTFETRGFIPFLISLAFYIILGPILLLLCLVNEIVRLGVWFYLQKRYQGKIVLVPDGADALWALKRQERTRMVVVCLKTDKLLPPEKVQENFDQVIFQERDSSGHQVYSKLTQILVTKLGFACWKRDDNFDLKNHIRSLSPNKVFSKNDMQKEITLMFQDMTENRPQWEIILAPRFLDSDEESETSLWIFRYQHAYMDGFSLITLIGKMGHGLTYYIHPQNFHIPFGKKMMFYLNAVIFGPYAFIIITLNKFKSFWPHQIPNDSAKTQTTYAWTNSMNKRDFASGTCPGGVSIGELAALLPYSSLGPQNRFAIFMYHINSLQDDFDRIRSSKEESWKGITGPWIPLSFFVFKVSGRMPVFMHHIVLGGGSNSLMMSNLPISKTKFRMLDVADLLEVWAFPPQPNDTGITLFSAAYENTLKIAISAESSWLKEEELKSIVERIPRVLNEWIKRLD
ncbi:unnamed protein product [Orchesella dallaii]|uniref:O-acyltransferase WSD1 C-terminal domain-containing protein n=1 Tax=Orchesella dallaii TaxID=48710 RepID=A0ABP1RYG6_9HEXA